MKLIDLADCRLYDVMSEPEMCGGGTGLDDTEIDDKTTLSVTSIPQQTDIQINLKNHIYLSPFGITQPIPASSSSHGRHRCFCWIPNVMMPPTISVHIVQHSG